MRDLFKTSKKILSAVLVFAILICMIPAAVTTVSAAVYSNGYSGNPGGDGKGILAYGMDISKWQGTNIDFAAAKAGGIDFVIMRAGYRQTTDPCFEQNYKAAKAAGLDIGAYWYSYALTEDEVLEEAKYCEKILEGKKFEYPIYFDFEDPSQQSLSKATKKTLCCKWMDYLASKNYLIGIYSSMSWLNSDLNPYTNTPEYECWAAKFVGSYSDYATYHTKYGMWQYTESGKIDGYSGNVDRSVAFRDYPSIVKKYGFNNYTAEPSTFTFKFMPNGGTGTMDNQKITYGTNTAISSNKFTNDGYEFNGWYAYRVADATWRYTNGTSSGWYAKGEQPAGYYRYRYKDGQVVSKTGLGNADTVKLYAVWGGVSYKVKYNANGGTGTMSNSSHINGVEGALSANTFTKSGNTFGGWMLSRKSDGKVRYILNSETGKWCVPGEQPDGYRVDLYSDQRAISALSSVADDVVTLKAYWIPNTTGTKTFYIDYNSNGGTGTMERQAIVNGVSTPLTKCSFVKPGYKFKAWRAYRSSDDKWRFKNSDGSGKWAKYGEQPEDYTVLGTYVDGVSVSATSSVDCDVITFYAEWEEDFKFTFTFDANGGEGTMPDQLVTYGVNTSISKNTFTKPGYKFAGWNAYRLADGAARYTNGTTAGFYTVGEQPDGYDSLYVYKDEQTVAKTGLGLDDTVLLKAVWEENFKFTFTFDANGGEGTMPDQLVTYGVNTTISKNTFTKSGYKFIGWNAYRLADGTARYTDGTSTGFYKVGEQPEGYNSLYIYNDEHKISKTGLGLDDVVKLVAVWEKEMKSVIRFEANGGEGTMPDQQIIYGEDTPISKNMFTKEGYEFKGWNARRDINNTWKYTSGNSSVWYIENEQPDGYDLYIYSDEEIVSKLGNGKDDTITLFAVWEKIPLYGDANGDGKVNILDVTLIQKYIAEIEDFSLECILISDANRDGMLNIKDVTLIQRYIAGLVDKLG